LKQPDERINLGGGRQVLEKNPPKQGLKQPNANKPNANK